MRRFSNPRPLVYSLSFAKREREKESTNTRGGKKISVRGFSRPIFLSFSLHMELLCFLFFGRKEKGERVWCVCVCVVFAALFFCLRDKQKQKEGRRKKKKEKKETACRLFPHISESVRERSQVRETIIISSSSAAAWRKVVAVVVVEMA